MSVYYISILRARQSFDPCAFALCSSSRLSPIFCPLLSSPICRNAFARALPFALPFPYFLPSFIVADMPQRFCSSFTACRDFPLSPACFLLPPRCRNAFARALLFVASFPRPFRFLSPPCAEVRSHFDLCRLYLPLFPRPQARGRVLLSAH